jgi:ATP-dependent helicase HepA
MPILDAAARFGTCVDREAFRNLKSGLPFKAVTFDRVVAETAHVELLRVGHPFVESLQALVRSDDRGAAFAVWRYLPNSVPTPCVFLRFDFVIEATPSHASEAGDPHITSTQALRRRADEAFPAHYRTVWLTSDLEEITDPKLLKILSLPYSKRLRADGSKDVNLRPERWDLAATLVSFGGWSDLCAKGRQTGERIIRNDPAFQRLCEARAARTRAAAAVIENAFSSRIARLSGVARESEKQAAELESRLNEGIAAGIEDPTMRVDSAGVVVLSSTMLGDK